jgi:pimeloyl-ACP methyl ester carboxylesterase
MKLLFGAAIGEKVAEAVMREASKRGEGASAHRRAGVVTVSVVAGMAAAIGAAFAIRENRSVDVAVLTPVEIAAGNLHGTLLSPRENAPVVLIVPGSGPTDRDGNSPLGVRANSYRLLAQALAKEGIASVRVDKRGMFGSAAAGDPNAVTVEKYADDYRAWIDAIRAQTGRKCVWLLGHSEGALMVSATAEGRKDVCGLILVAGMGRKMGDVLREQLKANPANAMLLDQAFAAIADLEAGRHVDTSGMHSALAPLFAPQVQDFLISVFATDPVDLVRRARVKTLVVQGATDLQVTEEDARLLNDAPRTKLEFIKGMNHILKEAPEDRAANLATYTNPTLPLHPRLVRKIEDFIEGD